MKRTLRKRTVRNIIVIERRATDRKEDKDTKVEEDDQKGGVHKTLDEARQEEHKTK